MRNHLGESGIVKKKYKHHCARMEYFLTMITEEEFRLSDNMIADLSKRLNPLITKSKAVAAFGGGRWGMGPENLHMREQIKAMALEAILKLHKPPPLKIQATW